MKPGADPGGSAPGAPIPLKLAKKIKTLKIFIKKSAKYANLRCAPPLNLNPGSAPESYVKNMILKNIEIPADMRDNVTS